MKPVSIQKLQILMAELSKLLATKQLIIAYKDKNYATIDNATSVCMNGPFLQIGAIDLGDIGYIEEPKVEENTDEKASREVPKKKRRGRKPKSENQFEAKRPGRPRKQEVKHEPESLNGSSPNLVS